MSMSYHPRFTLSSLLLFAYSGGKKKKMLSRIKINRGEMLVHVMQSRGRVSTFRKAKVVKKAEVLKKTSGS